MPQEPPDNKAELARLAEALGQLWQMQGSLIEQLRALSGVGQGGSGHAKAKARRGDSRRGV